jgi:hypothetical protein
MMTTLEKVRRLGDYLAVSSSVVDPMIETTINKLLAREFSRLVELKARLTNDLQEFEERHALKSDDFYERYEAGELGDAMDFVEWAATVEMLTNVKQQLALLETAISQ